MIESRCGILCSACSFKKDGICSGCLQIQKPFWGDACPAKDCCESKKQEHCGTCKEFPCDLLNQFAYDESQGDNGLRIEQCKKWKNNQQNQQCIPILTSVYTLSICSNQICLSVEISTPPPDCCFVLIFLLTIYPFSLSSDRCQNFHNFLRI